MMQSTRHLAAAAGAVAGLPTGDQWPVHINGTDVWLSVEPDTAEIERRWRHGAQGEVLDRDLIRALDRLPYRLPCRHVDLSAADARLLERAPSWVVTHDNAVAIRRARPALRVLAALVLDDHWSRGLDRASSFAAFCPRVLVLTGKAPTPSEIDLGEADLYGIGIIDARRSDYAGQTKQTGQTDKMGWPRLLLRPDMSPRPFGPATWGFAEKVFTAHVADSTYASQP
jgi:hypothetical protein